MLQYRISAFLVMLLFALQVRSQHQELASILYPITEQNGLSDNQITCFQQDHRGFMWIGTQDGLNLYDGSAIRIFRNRHHAAGEIADNFITGLAEDGQHRIWISTDNGLSRYDPLTDSISSWRIPITDSTPDANHFRCMQIDGQGQIWLGSSDGLLCFDPGTAHFSVHSIRRRERPYSFPANGIERLLIDRQGRFWLGTYAGVWRYFPADDHFEEWITVDQLKPDALITCLAEDHLGRIWFGAWNSGLKLLDPDTKSFRSFYSSAHLLGYHIAGIAEVQDPSGRIHLYTVPHLAELNEEKGELTDLGSGENQQVGKPNMSCLYHSPDNLLWIGSDQGLRILDPDKQVFHHRILSDSSLSGQGIDLFDNGHTLFVGAAGRHFLSTYDSLFQFEHHLLSDVQVREGRELTRPAVLNFLAEDSDRLWICTERGLLLYNNRTGSQKLYQLPLPPGDAGTINFINKIFIDSKKRHWVFPWRNGIWQLDPVSGRAEKKFSGFLREHGRLRQLLISDAVEDRAGNIWMADLDEGLILYDDASSQFSKPVDTLIGSKFLLSSLSYQHPWLWFVARGKVYRLQVENHHIESWDIPPAYNKLTYGFCADRSGHLWICTINGLLSFDMNTQVFRRFTHSDGLLTDALHGIITSLHDGRIVYAGENFLTWFYPNELFRNPVNNPVFITGLYSQNQSIPIRTGQQGEKKVQLDYQFDNFSFHWALPNYSNPFQNQYFCKLEGVDKDWRYVGNRGEAQYASLKPGDYTFRVRAATANGSMSRQEDEVYISIASPFWTRWWFVLSGVLLTAALLYGFYRYRLQQVVQVERLRSRISTDLHDDIGSTLSSISIMSDLALKENGHGSAPAMQEIKENSLTLMERMDDIVWSINPRNDSLENLLLRVKQFASRLFEARNIDYTFNIKTEIGQFKLPMDYRQHIYLILKEAINNIVKYAQATRVSIDVSVNNRTLMVTVSDNGRGFERDQETYGNGILNMEGRAARMNGDLLIETRPGEGTRIVLLVKIK